MAIKEKEDKIVLTEDEKSQITLLQEEYSKLIYIIGELSIKRLSLVTKLDIIDEEIQKLYTEVEKCQQEERKILEELNTKYGLENINM